ncbi:hypothetical protein [Psychromonas sp. GE-S-Ul-11]|uniref:hypothetical protein n=1 Tax=Psychromonas sp. GE-S-Ul-11 TaxID=3241170 RepID=UPI00390C6A04
MFSLQTTIQSFLFLLIAILSTSIYADQNPSLAHTRITVWQHTIEHPDPIFITILIKALDITRHEYGEYEIVPSKEMEQGRAVQRLAIKYEGVLDVAHFASSLEREKGAIAVKVPLLNGLLGYRVCLINKGDQPKFSNINNKQAFIDNRLTIGQHQDWPDAHILKSSGLDVRTSYKYSLLFQQLKKQRFDCYLRGINEVTDEYEKYADLNFEIENTLLFHYPFPIFFFVHESDPELAQRITLGLTRLKEKGALSELVKLYHKAQIDKLHLDKRKLIAIDNVILPEDSIQTLTPIPWLPL